MWKHTDKEGVTHMTSDREVLRNSNNDLSRENAKYRKIAEDRKEIIKQLEIDNGKLKDAVSILMQEKDALKIMLENKSILRTIRDKFKSIKFQSPIVRK